MLSQNHICYHWLSVSVISKRDVMHCGILINMPYYKPGNLGLWDGFSF